MSTKDGPDFLGIGAQKAGTSWLWKNLRQHPEIWTPPIKELHYFDRSRQYLSPNHLTLDYPWQRIKSKRYRRQIEKDVQKSLKYIQQGDWQTACWLMRYRLGIYNDRWYLSLFQANHSKVTGEITPAYSMLNAEDVKKVSQLLPNLKIIFLIRNPIDRAWSHVRHEVQRNTFKEIDDIEKIKQVINQPEQVLRSNYLNTLEVWKKHFPDQRIFIGFFDEILISPTKLLEKISDFLAIDSSFFHENLALQREKVYASPEIEMPNEIRIYLHRKYHADLQSLSQLLGGYAREWLAQSDQLLEK